MSVYLVTLKRKRMNSNYRLVSAIEALTEVDFDPWLLANNIGIGISNVKSLEFVVMNEGEPVGLAFTSNDTTKIEFDIAVVKEHEGLGVGTALVDACIDAYEAENLEGGLTLEAYVVNPAMRHMLAKRGFEISSFSGDSVYMIKPERLSDSTRLYHVTSSDFDEFDLAFTKGQLGLHVGTIDQIGDIACGLLDDGEDVYVFELDLNTSDDSKIIRLTDQGAWDSLSAVSSASKMLGVDMKLSGGEKAIKSALKSKGVSLVRYQNAFEGNGTNDSFVVLDTGMIEAKQRCRINSEAELEEFVESRAEHEPEIAIESTSFEDALKKAISSPISVESEPKPVSPVKQRRMSL